MQQEVKTVGKRELDSIIEQYMDSDLMLVKVKETRDSIKKTKYSDALSDLEQLQRILTIVSTRDQQPYQLLDRDETIYDDQKHEQFVQQIL